METFVTPHGVCAGSGAGSVGIAGDVDICGSGFDPWANVCEFGAGLSGSPGSSRPCSNVADPGPGNETDSTHTKATVAMANAIMCIGSFLACLASLLARISIWAEYISISRTEALCIAQRWLRLRIHNRSVTSHRQRDLSLKNVHGDQGVHIAVYVPHERAPRELPVPLRIIHLALEDMTPASLRTSAIWLPSRATPQRSTIERTIH